MASQRIGVSVAILCVLSIAYYLGESGSRIQYDQAGLAFVRTNVVLVLWTDHIELRRINEVSGLLPRPKDAAYSFLIPQERLEWVKQQVQQYPFEHSEDSGWCIEVRQIGRDRQKIEVDRIGHHTIGLIYEATPNGVVPLETRRSDPFFWSVLCLVPVCLIAGILYAFGRFTWKALKALR